MDPFSPLGLSTPVIRAAGELGYEVPTPIQLAAIPAVLAGRDVRGLAPTGSGKTAAFVLPILQRFADESREQAPRTRLMRVLVLAPTRELAAQIADAFADLGHQLRVKPKTCLTVGGLSINPQMMELRGGADIVVATPGRALDLVDHNALDLSKVDILVLDEADRLLSLGFADELKRILALLPARRQNLLFSATFPSAVQTLAENLLRDPVRIDIDDNAIVGETSALIAQRAIFVDPPNRTMLLRHLLAEQGWSRALVFVATRYTAGHVAEKLERAGIVSAAIHGDLSQTARSEALADFKSKRVRVLVATDLAARGIDVVNLAAVVNYDLPRSTSEYLHRIGRTGRAGESGVAVSFVSADTDAHFRLIEKRHGIELERERIPGFEPTILEPTADAPQDVNGGIKGRRKSKKDKLREAVPEATKEKER